MFNRLWSARPLLPDLGLLVIRLSLAVFMLPHGLPKLLYYTERMDKFSDPFGIGSPASLALAIFAEFFCSILLGLGLLTRFALVPLIITMATAAFIVHAGDPFGDREKALLYLLGYLGLFFTGPGKISVDGLLKR
ncbi:MAG: DoxX family protein [Cyclobacteriaceae bacterium]|nr:DoxX family protein [Cyclobacteriaceae bacterium]